MVIAIGLYWAFYNFSFLSLFRKYLSYVYDFVLLIKLHEFFDVWSLLGIWPEPWIVQSFKIYYVALIILWFIFSLLVSNIFLNIKILHITFVNFIILLYSLINIHYVNRILIIIMKWHFCNIKLQNMIACFSWS